MFWQISQEIRNQIEARIVDSASSVALARPFHELAMNSSPSTAWRRRRIMQPVKIRVLQMAE